MTTNDAAVRPYLPEPKAPVPPEMINGYINDLVTYQQMGVTAKPEPGCAACMLSGGNGKHGWIESLPRPDAGLVFGALGLACAIAILFLHRSIQARTRSAQAYIQAVRNTRPGQP